VGLRAVLSSTVLAVSLLSSGACSVGTPAAANTTSNFTLQKGYILRVYTEGGPAGAELATTFPAATAERGFTVQYDTKDRMLAVAWLTTEGPLKGTSHSHYFIEPIRWTILPE
jgi:hypothetical protein